MNRRLILSSSDYVVTAYAESARGPGWANDPIWVVVGNASGRYRLECLQPDEHTAAMTLLYPLSQAAHVAMTREVARLLERKPTGAGVDNEAGD